MNIRGDYENVYFTCEACSEEVTLNRATDLASFTPISGQEHPCPACGTTLWLAGDIANPAHELFVFEAIRFHHRKRYMLAISTLTQAWEMMFALFLRFNFASRPYCEAGFPDQDLNLMNQTLSTIFTETRKFAFSEMLNAVSNTFVRRLHPTSQTDGLAMASTLSSLCQRPKAKDLAAIQPASLATLIGELYNLKVAEFRNKVAHKEAYRPTLAESEQCIQERKLLTRVREEFGMNGPAYFLVA